MKEIKTFNWVLFIFLLMLLIFFYIFFGIPLKNTKHWILPFYMLRVFLSIYACTVTISLTLGIFHAAMKYINTYKTGYDRILYHSGKIVIIFRNINIVFTLFYISIAAIYFSLNPGLL